MAARTLTYTTNMAAPPKGDHIGENVLTFDFNSGATKLGTVSDMVLLGKIPNKAVFTGADIRFGVQASAASTWTLLLLGTDADGTFTTLHTLLSSGSVTANASTVQQYRFCVPQKISISDDRAVQYAVLALNCTVGPSETVSYSFQGTAKFLADGRTV
jgi:hypothetical protein